MDAPRKADEAFLNGQMGAQQTGRANSAKAPAVHQDIMLKLTLHMEHHPDQTPRGHYSDPYERLGSQC